MASKKELLALEIARAVDAGRPMSFETVDFSDPNRPKTCLEVDFPILPINHVAQVEGNSGKPIYQMSKWWARRRSSVFRSLMLSAAMKAPEDKSQAAKDVHKAYYRNHQNNKALASINALDIFMGGGTTLVEGSRLGMKVRGVDLNPVAWFVVKQEFAQVEREKVQRLLDDVEAEVRPQIAPFFSCDGPDGEKGTWSVAATEKSCGKDFDPLQIPWSDRAKYRYDGPELIYTFWAKHGPCQVTGCGHRTPIMSSPVMATKTLTVKAWPQTCAACSEEFDVEEVSPRMAPGASLVVAEDELPFVTLNAQRPLACPHCSVPMTFRPGKSVRKKVELTLLVHPKWMSGAAHAGSDGQVYGGSPQDDAASTHRWDAIRAASAGLIEVRGTLPDEVECPNTRVTFSTGKNGGNVPKKAHFACAKCGTVQSTLLAVKATAKTAPAASYAIQGYSRKRDQSGAAYSGRFFAAADANVIKKFDAAVKEWEARKDTDLAGYWPISELPYGFMTHTLQGGVPNHGYTHWWTMYNPRQLLVHSLLLKAICTSGTHCQKVREYVLGAFQQYLRNQNMFCIWNVPGDKLEPLFSNNNFHPKSTPVENSVFGSLGRGNWTSCIEGLTESIEWKNHPWEQVSKATLAKSHASLAAQFLGKSERVKTNDPLKLADIEQRSSTDLSDICTSTIDLVITDPPFGGLIHYSELSDFFYVWLRLALKDSYPKEFAPEFTPKSLEAVANRARQPEGADEYYKVLLTECWREAYRVLKPGGILAFTFHHSEDEPWVAVLESLFEAGFYLEAAYPIRSDETKGEGSKPGTFGSQQIEYDIIHVCRKRVEDPRPVSWARMRREVLADVRQIESALANHAREGLPAADLQVIRRGKALEYYSRHYGQVFLEENKALSVAQALVGINQLIEEETDVASDIAPTNAEPLTRQFLRMFRGKTEVDRDQVQKYLRGTGVGSDEFGARGWSVEKSKRFQLVSALDFASAWKGRQRKNLSHDYDQAWFLIGACHEGSGINAADQLKNDNFKPHPALKPLLEWISRNGATSETRQAAVRATTIYNAWADAHREVVSRQLELFA